MGDETRNLDRSNMENYGPAREASQPIRARNFTESNLCHIIFFAIHNHVLLKKTKNKQQKLNKM